VREVRIRAPAKVNLALRILGRRESGYHDLETLFQAVDLCDDVSLRVTSGAGIDLEVSGADVGPAEDNLVVRAARAFLSEGSITTGLSIRLEKRIPAGAGLGGGSSDAGATLRGLRALFPEALDRERIAGLAATLGSDVPFFVGNAGLSLGRGRGEVLRPLPPLPEGQLVIGCPPVHVATAGAFGALARSRAGGAAAPAPASLLSGGHPLVRWDDVAELAVNDFEATVTRDHPLVAVALDTLRATDPVFALLSGSGAAVFGVYTDASAADEGCDVASAACPSVRFVRARTLSALPGLNPRGPTT
jgi:4-diphosphocytidyl-2-C-methyl-D-erythritol kinase